MYSHKIERTESGKYRLTIETSKGVLVYDKEYNSERQARNGTIEFMYSGSNVAAQSKRDRIEPLQEINRYNNAE